MKVLGLDFETTGLDTKDDRIVEIGAVVWDVSRKIPLDIFSQFLITDRPLPEEVAKLIGIDNGDILAFGCPAHEGFERLEKMVNHSQCEAIVTHNGIAFDMPMLLANLDRVGVGCMTLKYLPVIDTKVHLPLAYKPDSMKLKYLAADHGFIQRHKHRALFDVLTMLDILSYYDISEVLAEMREPRITIRADVSYEHKDIAKNAGYRWEQLEDYRKFPKMWVKRIKRKDFEVELAKISPHQIAMVEDK